MVLDDLPSELLTQIFLSCTSLSSVINLARSSYRLHRVFSTRRLQILHRAAEEDYGPLEDAFQLVTHNASQPAHILRNVPLSEPLLKQAVEAGRVTRGWEEIYPWQKWKDAFEDRRLLTSTESFKLRRAVYRYWLYTEAFHNSRYGRFTRNQITVVRERAELLHNWTNTELAEIQDLRNIMRSILGNDICPSNGAIQRQFQKRFPGANHQLMFNIHLNYPPPPPRGFSAQSQQYSHHVYHPFTLQSSQQDERFAKLNPSKFHDVGSEGWGDDIQHYYVIEDMMKLSPRQILHLKQHAPSKSHVLDVVHTWVAGEWFDNNGDTFGQTMDHVLWERGEQSACFREAIDDGEEGIAISNATSS